MITKISQKIVMMGVAALISCGSALAAGDVHIDLAPIDLDNQASLQRGARLYMDYCSGCHSLEYMRYNRLASDLGISEEQLQSYFIAGDAKPGDTMTIAMREDDARAWLGAPPPDLSLIARRKASGPNWTYTFLRSFYADPSRPTGWNNTVMPNTSMPNVLWALQGVQYLEHHEAEAADDGHGGHAGPQFGLAQAGSLSEAEFDDVVTDLTAFLDYVGEPAKLKRYSLGWQVMLYLSLFTFIAYLLKREFWKDVH